MPAKWERTGADNFSTLTPWETDFEDAAINRYCSDFVEQKKPMNFPAIANKKRAASHCTPIKNENQPPTVMRSVHEMDPYHRAHHTITQGSNRSERPEKKKCQRGALQELSVKNFVIEGQQNSGKEKILRKRESSYILKQKFAEFRRSTKLFGQQNGNLRVVRYDN